MSGVVEELPIGDEGSNDQANGTSDESTRICSIRALRTRCGTRLPAQKGTSVSLPPCVRLGLVAACCLLTSSTAFAAGSSSAMTVNGGCAGDIVSGRVVVRAQRGTPFTLGLLRQAKARRFRSNGKKQTLRFRFDVSTFDAYAYRLRLARPHRRVFSSPIMATSCAPGEQVPESPLSILLPLSLLGTSAILLIRRRRSS
jgi:hypothetical protein